MDIRQYDLYIDGLRLPPWFLADADTQLGQRPDFQFDGWVGRSDAPASPHHDDLFAPNVLPFAQLEGHRLAFKLIPSSPGFGEGETHYVSMNVSTQGNLHARVQGAGNEVVALRDLCWELEFGEEYVIYVDYFGAGMQMTVEARRCRLPLRDLSRAHLNRTSPHTHSN
jgi:hypothetical protein